MMFADILITARRAIRVLAADRRKLRIAILLCIIGGGVELVGVGTLYPFLSLLTRPELIERNELLNAAYIQTGFKDINLFLMLLGGISITFFFLANVFLFLKNAYITRFCISQTARVSSRLLDSYLQMPMKFHLHANSGALSKDVIEQSDQFTNGVLMSVMVLISEGVILLVLIGLILAVEFKTGLVLILTVGMILSAFLAFTRSKLHHLGRRSDEANASRFTFAISALQSIKEIKVSGKEKYFLGLFRQHAERMAYCYTRLSVIQLVPTFLMQFVAGGVVIGIAMYYLGSGRDIKTIMPTLIMYAVVGYRVMPSVTKLATAVAQLRQFKAVVSNVTTILSETGRNSQESSPAHFVNGFGPAVEFRDIGFSYEEHGQKIIEDLSFQIRSCTLVGFVGPSGAGKTTVVDLMLGLLEPNCGEIVVGGRALHEELNGSELKKLFAYVPQAVYITDGTIADNIAFGISPDEVDWNRIREVVKLCHLEDFVGTRTEGLHAFVGERGARLSGGQRQRIGIARALYVNPSILILDESTNSLDGISEQAIIATLIELKKSMTIVVIAHRKSLVQHCDRVIMISSGKIAADGNFDYLMENSPVFTNLMSEFEGTGR